jgi:hypothetical protein
MGTDDVCRAGSVRVTLQNRLPRKGTVYVFPEVTSEIKRDEGLRRTEKHQQEDFMGSFRAIAY